MTTPIPLRQASGDPACADVLHRARIVIEIFRERMTDDLAGMGIGHPMRLITETAWCNMTSLLQAINAIAPERTRMREDRA